jgi:hypothetical protein
MADAAPTQVLTKTPETLTGFEKALAWALAGIGVALIMGSFIWFGASTDDFTLKSKEVVTSEPVGGSGTKTTKETDYADTVVIFALTIGAAFTLAGAFYGRLREITIGGATLKVGPTEEERQAVTEKTQEKIKEKAPGKVEILAPAASAFAEAQLEARALTTIEPLTEEQLDKIADAAVSRVLET